MSLSAVNSIYDFGKSLTFTTRNVDKTLHGDIGRGAVAAAQLNNAAVAASEWNNVVGKTANAYVKAVEKAASSKSVLGYAAKGLKVASKYVNPLIVVSSGIRVARAKDKKSEAIKQGCALTTMFTAESIAKKFLTEQGREILKHKDIYKNSKIIQSVCNTMNNIDKYAAGAKTTKWGKIGIPVLKAIAFVGMSIGGYAIGAKIADEINKARKNSLNVVA